jgi:hypothetical protein
VRLASVEHLAQLFLRDQAGDPTHPRRGLDGERVRGRRRRLVARGLGGGRHLAEQPHRLVAAEPAQRYGGGGRERLDPRVRSARQLGSLLVEVLRSLAGAAAEERLGGVERGVDRARLPARVRLELG